MSTPAHFDSENISQTDGAQSSRVPTSLPNDLYLTVGQAHTPATIDTESEPEEAPTEIEEFLLLVSRPPLTNEEFEASEPSDTRITSSHSTASSDSTTPLSPDHPVAQTINTQPEFHTTAVPHGISELVKDTEDESSDSDTEGESLEDEGPGLEEEAAPEGQQQAVPVVDTTTDEPLSLGYGALRRHELALRAGLVPSTFEIGQNLVDGTVYTNILIDVPPIFVPIQTPPSPEWSSGSLPVSPSSLAVPTLVASLVTTPTTTIAVDKHEFLKVGVQLELHGSILHDHIQCLDALPPTLFEGYDRDLRELYTRLREVRDEIFS
ncbi:hypothetical protein Tco_0286112 [Tanacetum coccineum]